MGSGGSGVRAAKLSKTLRSAEPFVEGLHLLRKRIGSMNHVAVDVSRRIILESKVSAD